MTCEGVLLVLLVWRTVLLLQKLERGIQLAQAFLLLLLMSKLRARMREPSESVSSPRVQRFTVSPGLTFAH